MIRQSLRSSKTPSNPTSHLSPVTRGANLSEFPAYTGRRWNNELLLKIPQEIEGSSLFSFVISNMDGFEFREKAWMSPLPKKAEIDLAPFEKALENYIPHVRTGSTGSDPEVFVRSGEGSGKVIPAFDFLPSAKEAAQETSYNNSAIYWDGFQAEFQMPPNYCHDLFMSDLWCQLERLRNKAKDHDQTAELVFDPVVEIDLETMMRVDPAHSALGCSPSRNVYGYNKPPFIGDSRELPYRFAGFHIHHGHFGNLKGHPKLVQNIVLLQDAIVGVVATSLLEGLDNPIRRQYYGRAGEYRLPKWGLEYRSLSSAALAHPKITALLVDLSRYACFLANTPDLRFWEFDPLEIQAIVNSSDVEGARRVLRINEPFLRRVLEKHTWNPDVVLRFIMEGAKNTLTNPPTSVLAEAWGFDEFDFDDELPWVLWRVRDLFLKPRYKRTAKAA